MWKKWRLFHATDFQSLMYPCFIFCRIIGIFPYKFNAPIFEASKPRYILSTVIICICFIYNLILVYTFIYKLNFEITRTLQSICYYTVNGFGIIIMHLLSSPRMRLLQTLLDVSSKLPPKSYRELSRFIHIKDIFGTVFLTIYTQIYFYKQLMFELNYTNVVVTMFTTYQALVEFQMNMLYINCVCILKACFKRINDNLAHMQRLAVNNMKSFDKSRVSRLICQMQNNEFSLIKLKGLKNQHQMISNTVRMLNIIFSLQILATLILTFSTITFDFYFYIVRWQDGKLILNDMHLLDVISISLIFDVLKLILIIWACETSKNQAREIGTTIHDVLNSTSDKQIKYELQQFSLQILHHKNTFWVKGLTMDAMLLTSMAGNITTYMLILIQFLIMSHTCDEKFETGITNNSII